MSSILIPEGFAHGFQTLEDNSIILYHHTQFYTPKADAGVRFDDPKLKIKWTLPPVMVSSKDKSYKLIDKNFKGIKI
jgi:dTDP-4-dehydrorhamnose 3,5-epimerase